MGRVLLSVMLLAGMASVACERPSPGAQASQPDVAAPAARLAAPERKPNILVFLIDTLRADRLNCYGYEKFTTSPSIDALAGEGVLFEEAYAPAPWTLPAVASLMTGKYACAHQTLAPRESIPPNVEMMVERLDRVGYNTIGLFANGMVGPKYGFARGYDLYRASSRNDASKIAPVLDAFPDTPLYLYVHNLEPHNPYHFAPPHTPGFPDVDTPTRQRMMVAYKGYRKASRADYQAKRPIGTAHKSDEAAAHMAVLDELHTPFSDLYDATVLLADAKLGSTIALLKQRGLWDDMFVVFLSDHGEEFGEHGAWLHDQSVYEEMVRVPLIIKLPGGAHAGTRVSGPVSLLDVAPTLAEVMGWPALAEGSRGMSLLPLMRGEANPRSDAMYIPTMRHNRERYFEPVVQARGHINIAVRFQHWKGIWNVEPDTFELYDLAADPTETNNRAADQAELVGRMKSFAQEWYAECQAAAHEASETVDLNKLDQEALRNLQTLGYADGGEEEEDDHDHAAEPDPGAEP